MLFFYDEFNVSPCSNNMIFLFMMFSFHVISSTQSKLIKINITIYFKYLISCEHEVDRHAYRNAKNT